MTLEERVAGIVERFREIGDENIKGLPIYNDALEVEAVGFTEFGDDVIGVLVTPWFMNLMVLPGEHTPWDPSQIGAKRTRTLPSGETDFVIGGDEVVGAYDSRSIKSPMNGVKTQERARFLAEAALAEALTPPRSEPEPEPTQKQEAPPSRRDLLRGRFRGKGAE